MHHDRAWRYYRRCLAGDDRPLRMANRWTGGQLPYGLHLWGHSHGDRLREVEAAAGGERAKVASVEIAPNDRHHMSHLAAGLEGLGWTVERHDKRGGDAFLSCDALWPDLVAMWGGQRDPRIPKACSERAIPCLRMENGFFRRIDHVQLDARGYLHRSSWAARMREPAPPEGLDRLRELVDTSIVEADAAAGSTELLDGHNRDGYILVLGQVDGDTQLDDSEIRTANHLQVHVKRAIDSLRCPVNCYFRPHPSAGPRGRSRTLPGLPNDDANAAHYKLTKQGKGLASALAGARFVVTINSNAAVEALLAGVPVLALGPHAAIAGGAFHPTTRAGLRQDIQEMLDGWRPPPAAVLNTLCWLAARQYRREEFSDPDRLAAILADCGL